MDKNMPTLQMELFLHSTQRAAIPLAKCVTSFFENVNPNGGRNILFLLYEHSTHAKNIRALQSARDSGAIMLSCPDHTMGRLQPSSLVSFRPLSSYQQKLASSYGPKHRTGKSDNILVVHREKQRLWQQQSAETWPVNTCVSHNRHFSPPVDTTGAHSMKPVRAGPQDKAETSQETSQSTVRYINIYCLFSRRNLISFSMTTPNTGPKKTTELNFMYFQSLFEEAR